MYPKKEEAIMGFVQILEFDTKQAKGVESLLNEWRVDTGGRRTAKHEIVARDHTRPDHYVAIVEFASLEDAQSSSKLPETQQLNAKMAKLCDGPVKSSDYDVIRNNS
jgi:quinol monooxygenase YgiN